MEYGLIGEVLKHSFSVEIHKLFANYEYTLKEIPKDGVGDFLRAGDFCGINVTIPYKQTVIPYLYKISDNAQKIGAVNTLVNKDGKLYGYNTDFIGMRAMLLHAGIDVCGKKVLILGSGGTSHTANAVVKSMGAKAVVTVSRKGEVNYETAYLKHSDSDIIINTTPVGMYPNTNDVPIDITKFPALQGVADAVYNPLNTKLVSLAKSRNIKAVGGLYMLVAQAAAAVTLFTGTGITEECTERVYKTLLSQKQNAVLIGMPSSGKSTIGKALAKKLNKEFIDTDELIERREQKTIPEIFKTVGEAGFRKIETEITAEVSKHGGCVIATGGGIIKNPENIRALKANGKIVFINRNKNELICTSSRPLSSTVQDLEKLYSERYPLYKRYADITVNTGSNVEKNVEMITESLQNESENI